jgi:hypothetical protein
MTSHKTTLTPRRAGPAIKYFAIALGFTAFAIAGTPALAATHHHHRAAQSLNGLHMYAGEALDQHDQVLGAMPMNESRAAAMHECNMKAAPYNFSTWETTQFAVYGTCMTEHGQMP